MAKSLEEYQTIIKTKTDEVNQLIGKRDHILSQLQERGFKTPEEAEEHVRKLANELNDMEAAYIKKEKDFLDTYGEFLG